MTEAQKACLRSANTYLQTAVEVMSEADENAARFWVAQAHSLLAEAFSLEPAPNMVHGGGWGDLPRVWGRNDQRSRERQ